MSRETSEFIVDNYNNRATFSSYVSGINKENANTPIYARMYISLASTNEKTDIYGNLALYGSTLKRSVKQVYDETLKAGSNCYQNTSGWFNEQENWIWKEYYVLFYV